MKIIVLFGKASCGKTTTLNLVYNELIKQGYSCNKKQQIGGDLNDFTAILTNNLYKIYFNTMGDYSRHIIDVINKASQLGCTHVITAYNNRFVKPMRLIKNYSHYVQNKTISNNHFSSNTFDSKVIISKIQKLKITFSYFLTLAIISTIFFIIILNIVSNFFN